jgi:hypothetical protein
MQTVKPQLLLSMPGGSEWIWIAIIVIPYFLPSIIAMLGGKSNAGAIFALNLLLGWSILGWVISLVWALTSDKKPATIIINNQAPVEREINHYVPLAATNSYNQQQVTAPTLSIAEVIPDNESSHENKIKKLQQLKQLLDSGVLTENEFAQEKAKVLG